LLLESNVWAVREPVGLDASMAETHVCVMDRDGIVIYEVKVPSTPADIATALAQVPSCRRGVFETGRMAPMLFHGLRQLGLPIVCVESRQAYQAKASISLKDLPPPLTH
jgi:transposase